MPWSSGRRDVINALQDVVSNLQRHLMRQFILTSAQYDPALGVGVGVDEDADEAILALRSGAESFMLAGYSVVNTLNESLARVLGSRYVVDRRSWRGLRGIRQDVLEYYFGMDENWFKEQIRVDRHGFFHLLNHIKDDDVFRNDSRNPQAPIEYQLMVALSHLGHHGNSNSARSVARQFRIAGELFLRPSLTVD
ncbi:hypothetical protein QFC24_002949 [Naganishia onofrii]|uniref:Uncharacterized protein n=1 Tax=Naganishia onofrii TaxID=1851511 RepID=A0ACC2XN19_9TREE|nr:hypothetical protein QFC24_002949 [Naganishia onofrii]